MILGLLIYPVIVRAMQEPEEPLVHSSDPTGLALVVARGTLEGSDTSELAISRELPDTSGNHALETLYKPQNSSVSPLTERDMLYYIRDEESSGNPTAQNPNSTAYGLYGFLNSTWGTVGCVKTSDPVEQERCAILYMKQRYGRIESAYWFHVKNDWY